MRHSVTRLGQGVIAAAVAITSLAATPAGAAAADAPNTCAGATTNVALNTWVTETISSGTDLDWYRFTTTTSNYAHITLGTLAKNYKLSIYNSACALITSSDRSGTQFEEILRSLPAGRYFVRVAPTTSYAYSTTPYSLRFRPLTAGVPLLSSYSYTDSFGYLHIPGEIFNNTPENRRFIKITATYYNSSNQVLKTDYTYSALDTVGPRKRSPFDILTEKPQGYHHYKLSVTSSVAPSAPIASLALTPGIPYTDGIGYRHYVGELTNNNSFAVQFAKVILTLYSNKGVVIATEYTYTDPHTLSPGQTAPFDVSTDRFAGTNRYIYTVEASRYGS